MNLFSQTSENGAINHILDFLDCTLSQTVWAYLQPFYVIAPKAAEFGIMMQNNCHYAIQGHSRSPILVPIESLYEISY